MTIPNRDELDQPTSPTEILETIVQDIRLGYQRLDPDDAPDAGPGSYIHTISTAFSNEAFRIHSQVSKAGNDIDVLTATGDALDDIREARGLPELNPTGSSGKVTIVVLGGGTANFADGDELVLPNGLRVAVDGTQTGKSNGDTLNVAAVDTGSATNADAGTKLRFADAPLNVGQEATVDANALRGGVDEESDEEKRSRILNRLQNVPGGINVSHLIEIGNNATAAAENIFVYPALGGAGSVKVVITNAMVISGDSQIFTRAVDSTVVDLVQTAIDVEAGTAVEIVAQSVVNEECDVTLKLKLPTDGTGFTNDPAGSTHFPVLESGDNNKVTVSAVTDNTHITVSALTTQEPVDGTTKIAWWSPTEKLFISATVTAHSGSSGAWVLTLSDPLNDGTNDVAVGDYISADADNLSGYRDTVLTSFAALGPGENVTITDTDIERRRRYRQPVPEDEFPSDLTTIQLTELINAHDEIVDAVWGYQEKTEPTVPSSVATAPNVLRLRNLAFYDKG